MWKTAVLGALSGLAVTVLIFVLIDWNSNGANYFDSAIEPSRSTWGYEADQIDGSLEHLLFSWQGRTADKRERDEKTDETLSA